MMKLRVHTGDIIFLVSFVLMVICTNMLSQGYFLSADETQYVTQAERFADGRFGKEHQLCGKFFCPELTQPHSYYNGMFQISKYPPGFSMILGAAHKIGVIDWVNPFLTALGLTLFFSLLRPYIGDRWSVFATIMLGLNPVYWAYGQSYFPHTLVNFLMLSVIWLLMRPDFDRSFKWQFLLALAMAYLVFTRISEAFCMMAALCVFSFVTRTTRPLVPAIVGLIVGGLLLMKYYHRLTGNYTLALYGQDHFTLVDMLRGKYALKEYIIWYADGLHLRTGELIGQWYIRFSGYIYPLLGMLGLIFISRLDRRLSLLLCSLTLIIIGFYSFFPYMGYPFMGIRYQSFMVIALGVFAVLPFYLLARKHPRFAYLLAAAMLLWQDFVAAQHLSGFKQRYDHNRYMFAEMVRSCPNKSYVFVPFNDSSSRYLAEYDLIRIDLGEPVVGVPLLRESGKHFQIVHLFVPQGMPRELMAWRTAPKAKPEWWCFPDFKERATAEQRMKEAQPYFLVPFFGDRRYFPPAKQ